MTIDGAAIPAIDDIDTAARPTTRLTGATALEKISSK
jgi:hypothetical protein